MNLKVIKCVVLHFRFKRYNIIKILCSTLVLLKIHLYAQQTMKMQFLDKQTKISKQIHNYDLIEL